MKKYVVKYDLGMLFVGCVVLVGNILVIVAIALRYWW